ncbi:AraC family transcriptional regulator [Azorhizobium oxalatiphilum]|uniref:AraC family transcriptional regulator n=1 Tax=Azorhizobium oxalatiphilum TaxID=980631 RepID=A0A917FKQ4_9HYPH|nr:AraC family transcriptional regulator [Azorhizobium oxalatiphilum]GGF86191.1 AraC family transcriptional regulator [Azorhizobium oxalatiphilum]
MSGQAIAASSLTDVARDWGYACGVSEAGPAVGDVATDALLARGLLATRQLSSGLRLCACDLTTLSGNRRTGTFTRSLNIMLVLDGMAQHYLVDGRAPLTVGCGEAMAVAVSDSLSLTEVLKAGDRTRSLVLQVHEDDAADPELAEALHRRLARTRCAPLAFSRRAGQLAHALFQPDAAGVVGRLRVESCALELLALALEDEPEESGPVHPRDRARLLAVRDHLLAHLDADHRLGDLARMAGMSPSSFKVKFAAVLGQPVFHFLREHRLERARTGLREEGWSVAQAAFHVGYRHPANFTTAFRRRFGVSPTAARPAGAADA